MSERGQAKTKKQATAALTDFVLGELSIGLQFAELARDSYLRNLDSDGDRQKAAAIHALQNAKGLRPQVDATESQKYLIEHGLVELTTALSRLDVISHYCRRNRSWNDLALRT